MIEKGAREMARTKSMGNCTLLYEMWNPDPNTITKDSGFSFSTKMKCGIRISNQNVSLSHYISSLT